MFLQIIYCNWIFCYQALVYFLSQILVQLCDHPRVLNIDTSLKLISLSIMIDLGVGKIDTMYFDHIFLIIDITSIRVCLWIC